MHNEHRDATFTDIALTVFEGKWHVIFFTVLFTAAASIYVSLAQTKFTVTMLIGPTVESQNSSNRSLASVALLGAARPPNPDYQLIEELLTSERIARVIENKYHYLSLPQIRLEEVNSIPSLAAFLKKTLVKANHDDTGLTTLSAQLADPNLASKMMLDVFKESTEVVRDINVDHAQRLAAYAESKFKDEKSQPLQQALTGLLLSQENALMMAKSEDSYGAHIIDGPNVSELPTWPRRRLSIGLGFVAGLIFGIFSSLIRDAILKAKIRRQSIIIESRP